MKIMFALGGRCWIGQEEGELQMFHFGSEGVQGRRVSVANSCRSDVRRARLKRETTPKGRWSLPRDVHRGRNGIQLSWDSPGHKTSPHRPHPHRVTPHSPTEPYSEPSSRWKATQLDFRTKNYQLSNFSKEKIATRMPYLFRRRCPLVLIVLMALIMETLVCLESDGQA